MKTFFVLWLILGNDKFPYSHHDTLKDCMDSGTSYVEQYNTKMTFKCVKWE